MKKTLTILGLFTLLFAAGCRTSASPVETAVATEANNGQIQSTDASSEKTAVATEADNEEIQFTDLTFTDLATRSFDFYSGAGAWSESFTIEKDGSFKGLFNDSDMGVTGEGYENGTRYSSSYSGHFTNLVKINEYTYEMKLADISYKEEVGSEEIWEGFRYIYTTSYCLGGTDTFRIYVPGTPLSELSEDILSWISAANESETELTMIIITDETNGYGIFSYERMDSLEDAQQTLNSTKQANEYYGKQIAESSATQEWLTLLESQYKNSDYCLNYIWDLIRYNVDEEEYAKLLDGQLAWISEKEAKAKEAYDAWQGGSHGPVAYLDTLNQLTMERCEELIEYLK